MKWCFVKTTKIVYLIISLFCLTHHHLTTGFDDTTITYSDSDFDYDSDDCWSISGNPNPEEDLPCEAQIVYDVARAARKQKEHEAEVKYDRERRNLQGTQVPVAYRKNKTVVTWTVCNVEDDELVNRKDEKCNSEEIGLENFDFRKLDIPDSKGRLSRINFMKLFFSLWPGNVHHQLLKLNARIELDNSTKKKNKVSPVSIREFSRFLGIMLVARLEGKKGGLLWEGTASDGEGYRSQCDMSRYMTKHRHSQLRTYFSFIFADDSIKDADPWWMVSSGVRAFNHNRRTVFRPARILVMDESMSAYKPRTTASGE